MTLKDGSEYRLKLPPGCLIHVITGRSSVSVTVSQRTVFGQPSQAVSQVVDLITDYEEAVWGSVLGPVMFDPPMVATHVSTTIYGPGGEKP